jgi:hypothetical protein
MKHPDDKPPNGHADERRRQFEESRGLRGRPELPLDEEDTDEDEDEKSTEKDERDAEAGEQDAEEDES